MSRRPRPALIGLALAAAAVSGAASAQVVVNGSGVRAGGVVVDSSGVHTPGADVTSAGVSTRTTTTSTTARATGSQITIGRPGAGPGRSIVMGNGATRSIDCHGGPAQVLGNGNVLTLTNCSRLAVPGNKNVISVALVGADAVIEAPGNGNIVQYRGVAGAKPRAVVLGSGNRVSEAR